MKILLHPFVVFLLTGLPLVAVCLDPVSVQIDKTPVQVASGNDAVFTVQTISDTSLIRWITAGDTTLAMWANGKPVVISVLEYQGRISVTATQLTISKSQLRDSGNYTVSVEPSPSTGLGVGTRSVQLKVFDTVNGVSLSLPGLPLEGRNVSLRCSWSAGTEVTVVWGKGGAALSSDTRITISDGSLVINPARRDDAGEYTCTVSNPVSARTAKANLSVYYGPDAPQLTKTSSECVGGGDATLGQTFLLTCTSASLPPASFSWELNGQPVTAGQSGSGVLSLQIFSTNQNGRYVCTARNDITGVESKQQMDVVIVGTCLSGGAVAGIVVACFVALIIIIIVIIVLLRQRKVDKRIKEAVELQKTDQRNGHTVTALPQNGNVTYRSLVNENVNPALHDLRTQNFIDRNIHATTQNNPLQHNGHLSTDVFQHNGHLNTNSYPNNILPNSRSIPQPGQHNPNILIQTGNPRPGAPVPTVHVNLNTLPNTDQHNSAQPHTVHVNLNTYPPEASQPSQQHVEQRESTLQRQHANGNQTNPSQTGPLSLENLNGSYRPSELIQTSHSHARNRGNANLHPDNSTAEPPRRSIPVQMPWDRLRGTPAYPNRQVDSSDSSGPSERWPRSPRDARRDRPAQVHRATEHPVRSNQNASAGHGRDLQRSEPNYSQTNPNMRTRPKSQNQTTPRHAVTQIPQGQNIPHTHLPQPHPTETHDRPQTHPQSQMTARPDHTSVPLTQEALRQHTVQAANPFTNQIQQTRAFQQNPGAPSQPTQQLNKSGQRAPTPPLVLQPNEFQTLPRGRMQQMRNLQPVRVISQPVHKHRSPDTHRRTQVWHTSPRRVPGFQPVHATTHGHPTHVRQVHRGRPRR